MSWKSTLKSVAKGIVASIPVVGDIYTIWKDEKEEKKAKKAEEKAMNEHHLSFAKEMETKRKSAGASKVVYAGVLNKPSKENLGNKKTLLGS